MSDIITTPNIKDITVRINNVKQQIEPLKVIREQLIKLGQDTRGMDSNIRVLEDMVRAFETERDILAGA